MGSVDGRRKTHRCEYIWGSANGDIRFGGWVLIWNTFPTSSDQPADIVLSADRGMGTPRSITTDGESFLIIGDHNAQGQSSQSGNWLWNTFPTESEQPHDGFLTEEMPVGWMSGDVTSNGDLMMIGDGIHVWDGIPQSGDADPAYTIDGDGWELTEGMVQRLLSPEIQSTSPTTIPIASLGSISRPRDQTARQTS